MQLPSIERERKQLLKKLKTRQGLTEKEGCRLLQIEQGRRAIETQNNTIAPPIKRL